MLYIKERHGLGIRKLEAVILGLSSKGVIFDQRTDEEAMGTGTPDLLPQQDTMRNIPKSVGPNSCLGGIVLKPPFLG